MYIPTWVIIIGVLSAFIYFYSLNRNKKNIAGFQPFYVQVMPNWYELLSEYKLIDKESWAALEKKIEGNDNAKYNVLNSGIMFTVLKSDSEYELIYNNHKKYFRSEVEFREKLEEIQVPTDNGGFYIPYFSVKWGIEGYELSITTPESRKKSYMPGDDGDLVKITTIPYSVFHMPSKRFGVTTPDEYKKQIERNGWIAEERDGEQRIMGWPNTLNHKYFSVDYKYI